MRTSPFILLALLLYPNFLTAQSHFTIGDQNSAHTTFSPNYIQGRSGSNYETLALNFYGGNVRIGQMGGYIRYNAQREATGIGAFSPESRLHIAGNADASLTSNGLLMIGNGAGATNIIMDANEIMARNNGSASTLYINRDGGNVEFFGFGNASFIVHDLPFGDHGNMQYNSSTGQFHYDNSSRRSKENITTFDDDWSKILNTRPVTYTRPENPTRWEYGYVAEEIDSIGLTSMIGYDAEGKPEDVRYDKMIIYLVEMLKIQQEQIATLQELITQQNSNRKSKKNKARS